MRCRTEATFSKYRFPVFLSHEQRFCLCSGQLTLTWAAMVGVPCR